ncbi:hypothetical protein OG871_16995 [Kitasatospora sp. NBC_00374]|uniref:hypothetical protein n=1 Tax=Kitasatospora sp. NBC_00374 TaxID=2975964 RepID=UPI003244208E
MALSKRFGWALLLLALAFPAAAGAVLTALAAVLVALLAHPTATCTVAAAALLVSTLPALRRATRLFRRGSGQLGRRPGLPILHRLDLAGDR